MCPFWLIVTHLKATSVTMTSLPCQTKRISAASYCKLSILTPIWDMAFVTSITHHFHTSHSPHISWFSNFFLGFNLVLSWIDAITGHLVAHKHQFLKHQANICPHSLSIQQPSIKLVSAWVSSCSSSVVPWIVISSEMFAVPGIPWATLWISYLQISKQQLPISVESAMFDKSSYFRWLSI